MEPRSSLDPSIKTSDGKMDSQSEQVPNRQEHVKRQLRGVGFKTMETAPRFKVDLDPRMERMLEDAAREIIENRDKYYVAGQKVWLSQEASQHQGYFMDQIVDGFFSHELENNDRLRSYVERNPKSFRKLQTAVWLKTSERLQDVEFTLEQQHVLKYQALQEFVQEGRKFSSQYRLGRIIKDDDRIVRQSSKEVFWADGFIQNEQEWADICSSAKRAVTSSCKISWPPQEAIPAIVPTGSHEGYHHIFDFKTSITDFLEEGSNYRELKTAIRHHYLPTTLKEISQVAANVQVRDIIICGDLNEVMSNSARNLATIDIKANEAIDEASKMILVRALDDISLSPNSNKGNWERSYVVNSLVPKALLFGFDTDEKGEIYFFKPKTFMDNNGINSLLFGYDSVLVGGIKRIIWLKNSPKNQKDENLQSEAVQSLEEYLGLLPAYKVRDVFKQLDPDDLSDVSYQGIPIANWIANQEQAEYQRLEEERLAIEEKERRKAEAKRRAFIKSLKEGVSTEMGQGRNDVSRFYVRFTDPSRFLKDFELTENDKEEFRKNSYSGLFNILLSEGRLGPGRNIKSDDREAAANGFFEAFNYAEYMDELNDWLTVKLEELHNNGESDRAKILKQRFRRWSKNELVASTFKEYSNLVKERHKQERQNLRSNRLRVYHDMPISEILEQYDSIYGNKSNLYIGNRFGEDYGAGLDEGSEDYNVPGVGKGSFMPRAVARERINALKQWSDFIKENISNADVEEALMVFSPKHDTLNDAMRHLDGNTYAVVSFNYSGKRCMIAECLGVNASRASSGAMKIWMGDIDDKRGWEIAFDGSKTEAATRGDCESINHVNIVDEVTNRTTDSDDYVVEAEDVMFRIAFWYFESGDKSILGNNAITRQRLANLIGPHMWRSNPDV